MKHNRPLKCPRCGKQSAYKFMGWAEDGRHYEQKQCGCGYEGQRKYMSLEMSNRLRERLAELRSQKPNSPDPAWQVIIKGA